jgi:hypothetical protein
MPIHDFYTRSPEFAGRTGQGTNVPDARDGLAFRKGHIQEPLLPRAAPLVEDVFPAIGINVDLLLPLGDVILSGPRQGDGAELGLVRLPVVEDHVMFPGEVVHLLVGPAAIVPDQLIPEVAVPKHAVEHELQVVTGRGVAVQE